MSSVSLLQAESLFSLSSRNLTPPAIRQKKVLLQSACGGLNEAASCHVIFITFFQEVSALYLFFLKNRQKDKSRDGSELELFRVLTPAKEGLLEQSVLL